MWWVSYRGQPTRIETVEAPWLRAAVQNGEITRDTLCWESGGSPDWHPIRGTALEGLLFAGAAEAAPDTPPPLPPALPPAAPQTQAQAAPTGPPPAAATGTSADAKPSGMRWMVFGVIAIVVILGAVGLSNRDRREQPAAMAAAGAPSSAQRAAAAPTPPPPPAIVLPGEQFRFVAAVESARTNYRQNSGNDMLRGATRPERARALCANGQLRTARDWIGSITTLSTNGEGRGVLAIEIASGVTLKTWNNALSDIGSETLLDPLSVVFRTAAAMRVGDRVRFSGQFLPDRTDCVRESSLTMDGSMRSPEFIFRFEGLTSYSP